MVTESFTESTQDRFSPEEQSEWEHSQRKLQEAREVAHTGQQHYAKADNHLSQAEAAHQEANAAAARQAEADRELGRHKEQLEGFKTKHAELQNTHAAANRDAEHKLAAHERAHTEFGSAERAAAEKENALRELAPGLDKHKAAHAGLEQKLAEHRRLTKEREETHRARQTEHQGLKKSHDANLAEVERLMQEHAPLRKELEEHEAKLQHLRKRHEDGMHGIYAAKDKANHSHQKLHSYDPDLHNHALEALESHKQREKELAEELAAAKHRAHEHQRHHDTALAAHKKAAAHYDTLKGRLPGDKEAAEARAAQEAAQRQLAELEAQAKHSHEKYRHHHKHGEEHGRRASELRALADRHTQAYDKFRAEGSDAAARKEKLWNEAKHHGDTGLGHFTDKVTGLAGRFEKLGHKHEGAETGAQTTKTTHATAHSTASSQAAGTGLLGHGHTGQVVNGSARDGTTTTQMTSGGQGVTSSTVNPEGQGLNGSTGNVRNGITGHGAHTGTGHGLTGHTAGTEGRGLSSSTTAPGTVREGITGGGAHDIGTKNTQAGTDHGLAAHTPGTGASQTGSHPSNTTATTVDDGNTGGGLKAKIKELFGKN